jgi:hypothetical protein
VTLIWKFNNAHSNNIFKIIFQFLLNKYNKTAKGKAAREKEEQERQQENEIIAGIEMMT